MLSLAATRPSTPNDLIDLLFDVSVAQQLMSNPDLHFSPKNTNVYFLKLYQAHMEKHAMEQALGADQQDEHTHHKRKM